MTLRVLHVDTESGWRGGERQTLWLAAELARRGHVSIVAARAGEPLYERAQAAGLPCVDCPSTNDVDLVPAWRLRQAIREDAIDVVHAHTARAVGVAALAALGTGVPLIASRRVDFRLRNNVGTRVKYRNVVRFIAVSHAVARVLEAGGVVPDRIRVVPDGVDVHRSVMPASRDVLASLGVTRGAPLVVQVAQLEAHKDPVTFVRAMARVHEQLPHAEALLVGDGRLRAVVEAEVVTLGLQAVVHVVGYRRDADSLLAAATVATLSSCEEGMGSVLLDALVFGRPVAATSAGGIPEVIVSGESGLLAPIRDPGALGDAIVALLRDDDLRERLAAGGRERAPKFSVEMMADRTIGVYEEILTNQSRS